MLFIVYAVVIPFSFADFLLVYLVWLFSRGSRAALLGRIHVSCAYAYCKVELSLCRNPYHAGLQYICEYISLSLSIYIYTHSYMFMNSPRGSPREDPKGGLTNIVCSDFLC